MSLATNLPDTGDSITAPRSMHPAVLAEHTLHVPVEAGLCHAE